MMNTSILSGTVDQHLQWSAQTEKNTNAQLLSRLYYNTPKDW